ncbi:DUF808 domain-containing protein [Apibacter muscae]|uniref:DUF808 domain-containing protein n=1 Tax=Apibacter muscae TaxID=2509004 RepID=A0A563D953_9FLAO|nr:DUF808 domain-containing protein [Apibacter muscae]TWP26647.1 DUF808 domain-containing protein [Apibacter muscae]TWP28221.1 DUF808 domain-containing protein [Apibacter muscae]
MASGIFAILDDIAALMDDVAVTTKLATGKTAGILGDDLAVNAEKATGFVSSRELPVLWKITKGSLINKIIIVPIAIALNLFFPVVIQYILILGGFYLAYEGVEKIFEYFFHKNQHIKKEDVTNLENDPIAEKKKIKSAIFTDFILSIEIVIIALGTVVNQPLWIEIFTVSIVAFIATVGVYGIVALIVRLDDMGNFLILKSKGKGILTAIGKLLIKSLPIIIKVLSIVGTIALLMVSGGIFDHNIHFVHHISLQPEILKQIILGLIAGSIILLLVSGIKQLVKMVKS